MITLPNYYKNEIYLPMAKSDVSDDTSSMENQLLDFIEEYEEECLVTCLGYLLANEFMAVLDVTQPNGLVSSADEKWDFLLNGHEYVNTQGDTVKWKGVRFKTFETGEYDRSFLAHYVYYFFESNDEITRSEIGHQYEEGKNSIRMTGTMKVIKSFRKFMEMVQGGVYTYDSPEVTTDRYGRLLGVDWMAGKSNREISLYRFISDMNNENGDDYYKDFTPYRFIVSGQNQFGI